jgi:hypothetical protein
MTLDRPPVEQRLPGVLVIRYEWPDHLSPEWQGELLELSRAASRNGPVALVFVLADRLRAIPPTVRGFWRTICSDLGARIGAVAVVTSSWGVEVATTGFGVTIALSGVPLAVQAFQDEPQAVAWASAVVRPAPVAASG